MLTIFWRVIKDRKILLLIYCLAAIGLLWMYVALYPAFAEQSASMEQMMKSFPEGFLKAFNFDIKSFTTVEGYLATEQFSFVWPLLVIFMTLGYAGSAFAGEIESGTINILLSLPLSRTKIFLSKYLAGLVMLIVFVFASIYAVIPLSKAYDINYHADSFFFMMLLAFLFALSIYSIGMLASAIFSDKGKVFFISGMVLVTMYVLNILASIKDSLNDLKYFSFFYYFNPSKALVYNEIDHWSYVVFISTVIMCVITTLVIFNKRDAL